MKKQACTLLASLSLVCASQSALVEAGTPTPSEVKKVLDYYQSGVQNPPILADLKYCDAVITEGEQKNNCDNELVKINEDEKFYLWMNFLVPEGSESNILVQLNHKGITRDTRNLNVSGAMRYRKWKQVKLSHPGEWTIKVFHETDDNITELYSKNVSVAPAPTVAVENASQ